MSLDVDVDSLLQTLDELDGSPHPQPQRQPQPQSQQPRQEQETAESELDQLLLTVEAATGGDTSLLAAALAESEAPAAITSTAETPVIEEMNLPPSPTSQALENSFDWDSNSPSRPPSAIPNIENSVDLSNRRHTPSLSSSSAAEAVEGSQTLTKGGGKERCVRTVLAGPEAPRGLKASSFSKSVCDNLRCVRCNFTVVVFPSSRWLDQCDYIFIRTHLNASLGPLDPHNPLRAMLEQAEGVSAYCCQCAHLTVEGEREVKPFSGGGEAGDSWVCGGHPSSSPPSSSSS